MKTSRLLSLTLLLLASIALAVADDESCPGGVCDESEKPTKKSKYSRPAGKKSKYSRPTKKNKYSRPGQKKNKYQRKSDNAESTRSAGTYASDSYDFNDPNANHFAKAMEFDEAGNRADSIRAFEAVTKFQPGAGAFMNYGVSLMRDASFGSRNPDRYNEAEQAYKTAMEMDPNDKNIKDNYNALVQSMSVDPIYEEQYRNRKMKGDFPGLGGGAAEGKKKNKYQRSSKKNKYQRSKKKKYQ